MPRSSKEFKNRQKFHTRYDLILVTGKSNPQLVHSMANLLKLSLYEPVSIFSDGEIRIKIPPNMRRRHVFIIQSTSAPVNDSIMELILMIDAAKRSSANEITVVVPYYGYSRQDRKEMPRVPISSSVVARMIAMAGADRIITLDIHSEQQQGFVKIPWDNLYASYSLIPFLKKKKLTNLVIASPDKGGMTRATGYARLLGAEGIALVYKERDIAVSNKSEALAMIGEVKNKNVLIVDDMLDTGGTIMSAAKYLQERGAKSIRVAVTHGIFSGNAIEKLENSPILEMIITDTIAQAAAIKNHPKVTVVSMAPLLAEAIRRVETGESISQGLIL